MSATTSLHLGHDEPPPEVRISTYPDRPPIGSVKIDGLGGITICATNPDDLWRVALAFSKAGCDLEEAGEQYAKTLADRDHTPLHESIKRGLTDSAAGRVQDLGSFTQYIEDDGDRVEYHHTEAEFPPCARCGKPSIGQDHEASLWLCEQADCWTPKRAEQTSASGDEARVERCSYHFVHPPHVSQCGIPVIWCDGNPPENAEVPDV